MLPIKINYILIGGGITYFIDLVISLSDNTFEGVKFKMYHIITIVIIYLNRKSLWRLFTYIGTKN